MLATHFTFERRALGEAVRRTFERRRTPIPAVTPIGLTPEYWENPARLVHLRAFARRAGIVVPDELNTNLNEVLAAFLVPILEDVAAAVARDGIWLKGGPWQ
jgi:hypothetical protein